MDGGCFSVSADGPIPNEPFCPTTKEIKKPTKPKMHRSQGNKNRDPYHCKSTAWLPATAMQCCWTQTTFVSLQIWTDAHRLDVCRQAERRLGTFIYLKYHIWKQEKLSHWFQTKLHWKRLSAILNTQSSRVPLSPIPEEPQTLCHINDSRKGN